MHNTSELTCPICRNVATQRFISKNQRDIWGCTNAACQHLFTPPAAIDQGFHQYPLDIAAESDQALELYGERNTRLLGVLLGELDHQSPLILLDFGAGNAHISRTFKAQLQDRATIYCITQAGLKPIEYRFFSEMYPLTHPQKDYAGTRT